MTVFVQRYLSAGVLTIWGVMLTYFFYSGRIASYLHPSFHVWTGISGVVLVVLAAGLLFLPTHDEESHCEGGCEHAHVHQTAGRTMLSTAILIIPLLIAAAVSPDQFGVATVSNRGYIERINDLPSYQPYVEPSLPVADDSQTAATTGDQPGSYLPTNEAGLIKAQTVDLLYAAEEPTMRADFENRAVELIGQFMPARGNNAQGDRFDLVRMFVICCAADARPVAITVQTDKSPSVAEMAWVRVTGKASFPLESGRRVPLVIADSVTPCDPPEESCIY
jgi:uncharacterized repeat protein (TIGR03943 family)